MVALTIGLIIGYVASHAIYSSQTSSLKSRCRELEGNYTKLLEEYGEPKSKYEGLLSSLPTASVTPITPLKHWVHLKLRGGSLTVVGNRLVKVFKLGEPIRIVLINEGPVIEGICLKHVSIFKSGIVYSLFESDACGEDWVD